MPKEKAPKYFSIKTKVEYEIVIEAKDKDEALNGLIKSYLKL